MKTVSSALIFTGALLVGSSGVAQARQGSVSDAQVEANVLKSLAGAPEFANQNISTTTVYGTVTLSGSVADEPTRRHAEQLAANTPGVQKVIDKLTLDAASQSAGGVLQSDGTYAPASSYGVQPVGGPIQELNGQTSTAQSGQEQAQEAPPPNGPDTDPYGRPLTAQHGVAPGQQGVAGQMSQEDVSNVPQYGEPGPYGQRLGARPYGPPPQPNGQGYGPGPGYGQQGAAGYGQTGGQQVTVPSGTILRVRVNQHLSSRDVAVGTPFDAMVVNDIVANGQVAIPRGAMVQGTVVDATSSGTLKGRGELGLRLTQLTLAGRTYPIASDVFSAHGGDKTIQTVNSAVGLGALGAIFGAVAGGGAGAAIGAGVGGALGIGSSAASSRGNVFIPSEAVLSFRIAEPASVTTVSQAEMQRLGYGVPVGGGPQMVRRYPPPYYYGPGYYPPRYYRPYGYYPY